jgi:hypothetical protein
LIVTIAAVVALMKFFEKRKKTSEKNRKPPSIIHFSQNWPENLGIFFEWP